MRETSVSVLSFYLNENSFFVSFDANVVLVNSVYMFSKIGMTTLTTNLQLQVPDPSQ